jgi:hypothetical protein
LLEGIGSLGPAEQGNAPNTLGTCTDGNSGTYHSDESVDAVKVSSTDGGLLTVGKTAEIEATVYAYSTTEDFVDFYYATNPSSPAWTRIGTVSPPGTGVQTIKMQYTLPSGSSQAVRVVMRYNGSASASNPFACPSSGYDDIDDIVFAVSGGVTPATPNPTFPPTKKPTETVSRIRPHYGDCLVNATLINQILFAMTAHNPSTNQKASIILAN